jgi:predicted HTH transcriptional regulator
MFADNNSLSVRVAKWWGTDKVDLRQNEEYGYCSLVKAMQKVIDKFDIENITLAAKVGIGQRIERKLVDDRSLREAIINSFAHNDYTTGETPVFEIYSDRFEFTSYGGLVHDLSQDEFFSGVSRPRNPEIMRIFKDLDYVERLGSGIPYIVTKYGKDVFTFMPNTIRFYYKYGAIPETFTREALLNDIADNEEVDREETIGKDMLKNSGKTTRKTSGKTTRKATDKDAVKETINGKTTRKTIEKTTRKTIGKTTRKTVDKILSIIQEKPEITMPELSVAVGISIDGMIWNIEKLKRAGIIERQGGRKQGKWHIINKEETEQ